MEESSPYAMVGAGGGLVLEQEGVEEARSLSLASLPPSPPPVLDRLRSGTGGLNSSRGMLGSDDPCRDSLFLGGRHSLPRSGLGFMGGLQRHWGPPVCGCSDGCRAASPADRPATAATSRPPPPQHHSTVLPLRPALTRKRATT
ncbi:hypothetical protein F7725_000930 [Dissostichus mawsoni]|uniref:Uncharacterized protein n=1 Tax=Dissostichus mawsoni TaxID=36200 RepID=A0A7J5ZFT8_DISMA|nr:hypothetical protein F7725_000930 [Dissostichus mawsoni]